MNDDTSSLYPLSPLQRGMLFHALYSPRDGIDLTQVIGTLHEVLRVEAFTRAWRRVVARHDALRTAFWWKDQPVLMQRVFASVELPFQFEDWRGMSAPEQERKLADFLARDRERGFDLSVAPVLRLALFQFGEQEHRFVWTLHHSVLDGRSFTLALREVFAIYDAILRGEDLALPPAPQYRDFIEWLEKQDHSASEKYWRETLQGVGAALSIDLPKRDPRSPTYHKQGTSLSGEATAALQACAARHGLTLNTFVQAAWAVLLARYSREEDIVFGATRACRHSVPGAENMLGLFINTLPMRVNAAPDRPLLALLKDLRAQQVALRDHEQTPLSEIQRWTGVAPLFRTIVVFEKAHLNDSPVGTTSRSFDSRGRSGYTLTLHAYGSPQLSFRITAEAGCEPAAAVRMLGHFATLLEAMPEHCNRPIGELPMLTSAEREQRARWNDTGRDGCGAQCIHELVEARAKQTPERVAVVFEDGSLSYGELNARANQLARCLQARGVMAGGLVGLYVERSCDMVVALLGILKAGAAYVPLDPAFPRARIAYMLRDSGAALVITQQTLAADLSGSVLRLDADGPEIARESRDDLALAIPSNSLAYVIYTSGSTGQPKGIAIEHRSVVNFLGSMRREPGLGADDVLLGVTTISFDIAALEVFLPLTTGAQLWLASRGVALDARRLARRLEGVTVMQATPATWRMLVQSGWRGNSKLKILCGGEALPPELARDLLARGGELWNMYGPTETTIWSTCHRVKNVDGVVSIGRPIANTTVHVLGNDRQPRPVDVVGELYIGGAGLARGYHNRLELTREKFIPDPFSNDPTARLYATGDLARRAPDGTIEVLGRLDHQIKIRGFRIEAGEIEARLNEHPAIRQSAVVAREDVPGEKALVAYIVTGSATIPTNELRAFLAERLPDYMIPSSFVGLDRLPLTPNGKVDRQALPAPERVEASVTRNYVAPRGPVEQALANIWAEVLKVKRVGIHDDFFELGGHSLLAVRLFSQIAKLTGKDLPLVTLFQAPTIERLAAILRQEGWESPWASLVPIKADGTKPPFYCVHGIGGNILEYLDLAKYMDADQPFYGLQAIGLDGKGPTQDLTVEQMAAQYIAEIRAFQPCGPYYLGGSSFGGLVAYEMAQQLCAAGEEVALLAFFDTNGPGYPHYLPTMTVWRQKVDWWRDRIALHWENLLATEGRKRPAYIREKMQRWNKQTRWKLQALKHRLRRRVDRVFWPGAIRQAQVKGYRAATSYEPQPYSGQVTLFRATEQPRGIYKDRTLGWGSLVLGRLVIVDTPGHHGAIVREPRARALADQLNDALARAQAWAKLSPEQRSQQSAARVPTSSSSAQSSTENAPATISTLGCTYIPTPL
ncbi:MAG TPA: amino acid adenylation domain-containing protein [Verrucomicrobiae bacterium]|nr:amino acid adenylation domain-containing protein [Verrucomicrobiae bacterium]